MPKTVKTYQDVDVAIDTYVGYFTSFCYINELFCSKYSSFCYLCQQNNKLLASWKK